MEYTVLAIPTPESKKRFEEVFMSSPVHIDLDKIVIRIGATETEPTIAERRVYLGLFSQVGWKFNQELQYTELIGTLGCPDIVRRHMELTGNSHEEFSVDVVFQSPATPMAATNKHFIASIHDTLVAKEDEKPFDFVEVILT